MLLRVKYFYQKKICQQYDSSIVLEAPGKFIMLFTGKNLVSSTWVKQTKIRKAKSRFEKTRTKQAISSTWVKRAKARKAKSRFEKTRTKFYLSFKLHFLVSNKFVL